MKTGWTLRPAVGELEQVREINAHLPFADPIELDYEIGPIPAGEWIRAMALVS